MIVTLTTSEYYLVRSTTVVDRKKAHKIHGMATRLTAKKKEKDNHEPLSMIALFPFYFPSCKNSKVGKVFFASLIPFENKNKQLVPK